MTLRFSDGASNRSGDYRTPERQLPDGTVYTTRMAFSDRVIRAAWLRAAGKCERCGAPLLWTLQGGELSGGWRVCRRTTWGTDVLTNCVVLFAACQRPEVVQVK